MAKKINFKKAVEVSKMCEILKENNIEHVRVIYPKKDENHPGKDYIVVQNKLIDVVRAKCGDNNILHIKNVRHYEQICFNHAEHYFEPKFKCKCRHCGKEFTHKVKEAAWCSDKCRKEFRLAKKQSKQ